jgi:hypothetical protein
MTGLAAAVVPTVIGGIFSKRNADRVGDAAAASQNLLEQSAAENIALQQEQIDKIAELTQPFRNVATQEALPNLSSLAIVGGDDVPFRPSNLLGSQLSRGREAILKQQSPGGIKSSKTFERLADLATGLAAEDVARFEQGQRSLLTPGQLATQQLNQASTQLGSNVGGIFSNLGQQINQSHQGLAQAQAQTGANIGQGIAGLSNLFLSQQG